jgi:hypothetical protein
VCLFSQFSQKKLLLLLLSFIAFIVSPNFLFHHNRKNSGKFGYLAKKSYLCIRIEELNGLSIRKFTSRTQQCVPTELLLRAKPEATVASESRCGLYAKKLIQLRDIDFLMCR